MRLKQKLRDQKGATAIEYGLIAALVSLAAIGAMTVTGNNLQCVYWHIGVVFAPGEYINPDYCGGNGETRVYID